MEQEIFDCPHCGTKKICGPTSILGCFKVDNVEYLSAAWMCRNPRCQLSTALLLKQIGRKGIHVGERTFSGFNDGYLYEVQDMWPKPPQPQVSDDLPKDVRQCMLEAEDALISAAPRLARGAFRTVLDVATKEIVHKNPHCLDGSDPTRLTLNSRIEKLAKHHLLTASLKSWAHTVRGITNEDVHGPGVVTKAEAEEIAEVTRMILKYLFELPASVEKMREAAQGRKEAAEGA